MSDLVIEKGIPAPPDHVAEMVKLLSPMEVGDSILFRWPQMPNISFFTAAVHLGFILAQADDSDGKGWRVWRVK